MAKLREIKVKIGQAKARMYNQDTYGLISSFSLKLVKPSLIDLEFGGARRSTALFLRRVFTSQTGAVVKPLLLASRLIMASHWG